jgi:hypothetical protein
VAVRQHLSSSLPTPSFHTVYLTDANTPPQGITDQVAKESKDSTASTHENHDVDTGATSGGNLHAQAHKANPVRGWLEGLWWGTGLTTRQGPVHADNLPAAESKENLKKRAEELNK